MSRRPTTVSASAPTEGLADRIYRWQPEGSNRWLEPGRTFTVAGKRGKFRFLAYVDAAEPYVEAVDPRNGRIRCLRPETVVVVHNAPKETR